MSIDDTSSDVIYISSLSLSANIGPDWWGRSRPQPLSISVAIHLEDHALNAAAANDDVGASVHYGHLCKEIAALGEKQEAKWDSAAELARDVAKIAEQKAEGRSKEVRVVVSSAKMVPLAGEYAVEVAASAALAQCRAKVTVRNLVIPAIIGVNPPEREAKQRIVTDIVIFEKPSSSHFADCPAVINKLSQVFNFLLSCSMLRSS